jgi:hypothetical protein
MDTPEHPVVQEVELELKVGEPSTPVTLLASQHAIARVA